MKIGLFGGSFDPPHDGHVRLAGAFYKASGVDLMIVMPSFLAPHKAASRTSAADRLAMTRLAFLPLGEKGVCYTVSDYEISRDDVSYTFYTVRHLCRAYGVDRISLCVGSDMLLCFDSWMNAAELLHTCRLFAMAREEGEGALLGQKADDLRRRYGADVTLLADEPLPVSSTSLREHPSLRGKLLDERVAAYIDRNGLYRQS